MAVVTLSRPVGSGGDEIAARVCDLLGYSLFNKRMMIQVAADVGLCDHEIVDFSEEHYKVRDFLSRLFGPRPVKERLIREDTHQVIDILTARELDEAQCIDLVRYTVLKAYALGKVVIVGRGGQAILKDKAGVLHVRIAAPLDRRMQALRAQGIVGVAEIKSTIAQHDRATSEYLRRFHGIDWNDPAHYHLTLNTGLLDIETAAGIVVDAVRRLEPATVG